MYKRQVSLCKALEQCQLEHSPPQRMETEEDKSVMLCIAEAPAFKNGRGQNGQAKDHHGDDVVSAVGDPAQPAIQLSLIHI